MRQVDGDVCTDMFRQMEARKEGLAACLLCGKLFGGVADDGESELLAAIQGELAVIQGESELLAVIRRLVDESEEEEEGPVVDNELELDDDELQRELHQRLLHNPTAAAPAHGSDQTALEQIRVEQIHGSARAARSSELDDRELQRLLDTAARLLLD